MILWASHWPPPKVFPNSEGLTTGNDTMKDVAPTVFPSADSQPPTTESLIRKLVLADVLIVGIGVFFALRIGVLYWIVALCGFQGGLLYSRYRFPSWSAYAITRVRTWRHSARWYIGFFLLLIGFSALWGHVTPHMNPPLLTTFSGLVLGFGTGVCLANLFDSLTSGINQGRHPQ